MSEEESLQESIQQAVAGDGPALARLQMKYWDRLHAHVAHQVSAKMRARVDVEGVLQEVFIRAWEHIGHFELREPEQFYGWLRTIADRRLVDVLRGEGRLKRGGDIEILGGDGAASSMPGLLEMVVGAYSTPSQGAMRHECEEALFVALAGLQSEYQETVKLRYLECLSVADTAARMSCSEGTVMMNSLRAKEKLRKALERFFPSQGGEP